MKDRFRSTVVFAKALMFIMFGFCFLFAIGLIHSVIRLWKSMGPDDSEFDQFDRSDARRVVIKKVDIEDRQIVVRTEGESSIPIHGLTTEELKKSKENEDG